MRMRSSGSSYLKFVAGYGLFGGAVVYGLLRAPSELWALSPLWLLPVVASVIGQFVFQWWQSQTFLRAHGIEGEFLYAGLFTARKGVLNAVLPVKGGTLVLLRMLVVPFELRWRDYPVFMLTTTACALSVSVLAGLPLVAPREWLGPVLALVVGAIVVARPWRWLPYGAYLLQILVSTVGVFLTLLLAFWCVLLGLGIEIGLEQAVAFSVALNLLAQVAITPANMGVREVLLGLLSPYLALPMSVGILAGAVFIGIRLGVNAILLMMFEVYFRRRPRARDRSP